MCVCVCPAPSAPVMNPQICNSATDTSLHVCWSLFSDDTVEFYELHWRLISDDCTMETPQDGKHTPSLPKPVNFPFHWSTQQSPVKKRSDFIKIRI